MIRYYLLLSHMLQAFHWQLYFSMNNWVLATFSSSLVCQIDLIIFNWLSWEDGLAERETEIKRWTASMPQTGYSWIEFSKRGTSGYLKSNQNSNSFDKYCYELILSVTL